MLKRPARRLLLASTLTAGLACAPAAGAKPPKREATCAAIAKETRALVTAAVKGSMVSVAVDTILEAIAPLGTCVAPVVGGGQWALVLDGPPSLERQDLPDHNAPEPEADSDAESPTIPVAWTQVSSWTPVFVTADGTRIKPATSPGMPEFDAYLDVSGNRAVPTWPHDDRLVTESVQTQANPDGSFSVAFANADVWVSLFRFDGKAVIIDPAQELLSNINAMRDMNNDGREDLINSRGLEIHLWGDGNMLRPFDLIAIALPDGTYTVDHPFILETYRKQCDGLGRSPWILDRKDSTEALSNIACGRIFGVPTATIKAGLAAEKATLKDSDDYSTIPAFELFEQAYDSFDDWFEAEIPVYSARTDGYKAVTVASATASAEMKAFGVYHFDVAQAVDGDLGTSWQPKKKKDAWIELKLQGTQTIHALDVANGMQRTDRLGDLFVLNSRGTRVTVKAGAKSFDLELNPDTRGFQRLDLPEAVTTDSIRVIFKASAKGSRWDHMAVSEIVPLTR